MMAVGAAASIDTPQFDHKRWLFFSLWLAVSFALYWRPVILLIRYSLGNSDASHILLIPFISAWVLFLERERIFRGASSSYPLALGFLFLAGIVAGCAIGIASNWTASDQLSGLTASLLAFWIAGFALFFGRAAVKSGWFALAFLFLAVPMPDFLLGRVIFLLQKGSADVAGALFDLTAVPVLREGFVFHLSRTSIEVATECSGIRSSLALLVLALLVAHFSLRTFWKKTIFVIAGLLMMVIKNGLRIVTLTLLANYVDPSFLYGWLHNAGGVVFFMLGLLILLPLLWLLRRGETPSARPPIASMNSN